MFDLCLWRVQTKSKSTWMSLATHCYFITMSHLSIRGSPSDGEYFRESEKSSAVLECTHLTLFRHYHDMMIWSCFFFTVVKWIVISQMDMVLVFCHVFFNPGGYDQIYSDGSQAKKTHSVGELEIFHQRKKPQEKTWKSYHKTSEGTLFPGVFEGKFFFRFSPRLTRKF